jgi:hypothetical protein
VLIDHNGIIIRNFSGFSTKDVALVRAAIEAAAAGAGNSLPAPGAYSPLEVSSISKDFPGVAVSCVTSLSSSGRGADERGDLHELARRLISETLGQSKLP